jgi:hypothetical protein
MKNKHLFILLLFGTSISSCFKEDEPIAPYTGEFTTLLDHIEYNLSFYDFETNSVTGSFPVNSWTLGFACNKNDFTIASNSGDNWFVYNTEKSDITQNISYPLKKIWDYDKQNFFPDSTAIRKWVKVNGHDTSYSGNVYLLGKYTGDGYSKIFKLQFLKVDSLAYVFCFTPGVNSDVPDTIRVQKVPGKNFVYYSFDDFQTRDPEPEKSGYDLVFGPYYDMATEIGITAPYLVRGTLLNSYKVEASVDSLHSYESLDSLTLNIYTFDSRRNKIGFSWKQVIIDPSNNSASYLIRPEMNYMVKTVEGNYFKMRFISYELDGKDGYPSFETKQLSQK